jgi:hypothetical protein
MFVVIIMKRKMKNKIITAMSTETSYLKLKLTEPSLDPYTQFTVGLAVGSAIVFKCGDENSLALFLGIGVAKGGRLIKNQSNLPVYNRRKQRFICS